jgi:predicted aspartyl protease
MRPRILICVFVTVVAVCRAQTTSDLQALYRAHKWAELNERLHHTQGEALYRGAIGVTFNQDPERTERLLLSVIASAPNSSEAYDASEWLSHLYFYRGQYRSLISIMERRWAAFPKKEKNLEEQAAIRGFRGLPNQIIGSSRPSKLAHDPESIFIPVSINGSMASYFFDTGAWISAMTESEAKRLRLAIGNTAGTLGQMAGSQVGFRTAVAQEVTIGNTHFKNVSFAVFPDNQEPWSDLAPGRRGIVGVPLLVGLQTLRWEKAATAELAEGCQPFDIQKANLTFDNDHIVVTAMVQGQKVSGTVDTGATWTYLYKPFADTFGSLLQQYGKKDLTDIHGVGHAATFDSVTLPQVRIHVGGFDTVLSPAHVLLKSSGAEYWVGNFGLDLFKQAGAFKLDFGAMTLQLIPASQAR